MVEHLPIGWKLAGFGEGDGGGDTLFLGRLDGGPRLRRKKSTKARQIVSRYLLVELGIRTVLVLAVLGRPDVIAPAIGHALQEARPLAPPHRFDRYADPGMQRQRIAVLDQFRLDAVGARADAQARPGQTVFDMRVDGIKIVLADEQDRQLLQRSEVDALVEGPLVDSAFAEEAGHDRRRL